MSGDSKGTKFEDQCNILAELWMKYRFEKEFEDFVDYNDLGLPLAFVVAEDLVKPKLLAKSIIEETFALLLASLGIDDAGFDSLDELLVG